jgi:anti-sigma B factor antagonist
MWNLFSRKPEAAAPADSSELTGVAMTPPNPLADIDTIGETAIITVTVTELTGFDAARRLTELLDDLGERGARHFVLDLQNVQEMDSATLGAMVHALRGIDEHGGRIAVVNAGRSVDYLFRLTRLDRVFPICKDVMAALAAVERAQKVAAKWPF